MRTLLQDLFYIIPIVRRHPTFTLGLVFALALGTGANTAIPRIVNAAYGVQSVRTIPGDSSRPALRSRCPGYSGLRGCLRTAQ